jgi:hypothetical protein
MNDGWQEATSSPPHVGGAGDEEDGEDGDDGEDEEVEGADEVEVEVEVGKAAGACSG